MLLSSKSAPRWIHRRQPTRARKYLVSATCAVVIIVVAAIVAFTMMGTAQTSSSTKTVPYLGVYEPDAPSSYAEVNEFAQNIEQQPNLVSYYSPWLEPFQLGFATSAAAHGAVTLAQLDPTNISLSSIAAGQYDVYLRQYATAVKDFGHQVILSFGHEMNGYWYSWGNPRTSPKVFIAAWRHIYSVFRTMDATNVTWLWTVNVIDNTTLIPNPDRWWPGSTYVNWVGIDGYYYSASSDFAQVYGPTIVDVRNVTEDPILVAETGAGPAADQQAKVTDLFAGVRAYGLLGFLWFDENSQNQDWRISSPEVFKTFRQDVKEFFKPRAVAASAEQEPSASSSPNVATRPGASASTP
jgi:mannan endo-1,4-beta-mannosidase